MPRKVQYSREIIIDAAIEMVRAKGADSINARDLGEWLGCSSRPLFTAFRNMEELIDAVRMEVSQRFLQRVRAARDANSPIPAAKRMGMCIVQFAQNEPNLYKFIHWTGEQMLDVKELSQIMATQYQTDYQLSDDDALAFFDHMMIFNMGLCSLITNGVRRFTREQVEQILLEQFSATLAYYKGGKQNIEETIKNGKPL
ncbi:MAG: TetR/AcrR family transcriptional regulator [Paludibacteraceae bacterium]|nr:TetR/AcrR family transcriptional regulator [Bacteroidales bacterium]MDY4148310.1 TetR/AcrR family transcriptional regulator [Paludibacteraceae bacterium]